MRFVHRGEDLNRGGPSRDVPQQTECQERKFQPVLLGIEVKVSGTGPGISPRPSHSGGCTWPRTLCGPYVASHTDHFPLCTRANDRPPLKGETIAVDVYTGEAHEINSLRRPLSALCRPCCCFRYSAKSRPPVAAGAEGMRSKWGEPLRSLIPEDEIIDVSSRGGSRSEDRIKVPVIARLPHAKGW